MSELRKMLGVRYPPAKVFFYRDKDGKEVDFILELILGILWSSFCRYFFFNITANWGIWHPEIHLEDELLQLPIPINDKENAKRVISTINKLRDYHPQEFTALNLNGIQKDEIEAQRCAWETELDEAVFDLYEFSEDQRDLIRDCCDITLPFFYQPYDSIGVMSAINGKDSSWLQPFAEIFARRWQPYLIDQDLKGGKTRKRPDFTCSLPNSFATNVKMAEISNSILFTYWSLNTNAYN